MLCYQTLLTTICKKTEDNANTVTECDVLILSDSMLKRIQPKRFTPEGKTIIRFIRGGAKVCSNFVEKYYHKNSTQNQC